MAGRKLNDRQVQAVHEAHALGFGYGKIRDEIIRRWGVDRAPSVNAIRSIVNGKHYRTPANTCAKGHPRTEENTIWMKPTKQRPTWRRRCRPCWDAYKRRTKK